MVQADDTTDWGDGISPDQTEIIVEAPKIDVVLKQFLDEKFGPGNLYQWQNEFMWVELDSGGCTVWNKANMRYKHQCWEPQKQHFRPTDQSLESAFAWLQENHDKPQPVPEQYMVGEWAEIKPPEEVV